MKFQHKTCSGTVRFCNWKLKSGMKYNKIVFSSFLSQIENHVHWVLNFPVNSVFAYDSRNSFWADLLKVAFSQNILMHLSFSQTYEPFIFLNMKIWILGICQPTMTFFSFTSQILRHSQFLSKFQAPKFKFLSSGKYIILMFEEMISASVLPEKNHP